MLQIRRFSLALLVAAGLFLSSSTSRAVDPRLLPADTEIVFTFNVKQVLNSDLVKAKDDGVKQLKAVLETLPNSDEVTKYLKQMGFDPFTHLTSISMAHPGNQNPKDLFVVIDGMFDAKKFADTAATAAQNYPGTIRISKFAGAPYYEIQVPNDVVFLALVNGKSIVLSSQEDVLKGAMTRAAGDKIMATKVKELLKATNDKQSISVAITGESISRLVQQAAPGGIPGAGDALANIQGLTGAITITKEINFQLGIGTKDAKTAKEIEAAGNLGLLLLKTSIQQKVQQEPDLAPLAEVVRTLRISSVGANAVLTGSVSQENLEKMFKALGKLKGGF